jgi:2-oxoglutarate/2-oxoacid ferredoxin oxidoreductase subunit alpha
VRAALQSRAGPLQAQLRATWPRPWGSSAPADKSKKQGLLQAAYPITPASDILNELSRLKQFGVRTFQAEDEIAAVCSAIGASFAATSASPARRAPASPQVRGHEPGRHGRAAAGDHQRAARRPKSTGLPTKTEQSDLLMALFGRNSAIQPHAHHRRRTPGDCF